MTKYDVLIKQLSNALDRFEEVLLLQKTDVVRDSAIKRFEIILDISWKTVKEYLRDKKGISCHSPKECFRQAYQQGIIEYDDSWLTLVDLRNQTVHIYDDKLAEKVFQELFGSARYFKELLDSLEPEAQK